MAVSRPAWLDPAPWRRLVERTSRAMVLGALAAEEPGPREFAILLSPAAGDELEVMAQRAQALTRRHFGRTISLYAPLYLSDYCPSKCTYCGFAADRHIRRHKLTLEDVERESAAMKEMGFEEILLLTGDRVATADFNYVRDAVAAVAPRFHTITVEVFAMTEDEYRGLAAAGCTGVTMYQETYDPVVYERLHLAGEKRDYLWRLEAPARALAGGIRVVGLGALLGVSEPLADVISLYQHATRLRQTFWKSGVAVSFPRIRPQSGDYAPDFPVEERQLAQFIFAFRICLPDVPLVLSTRESPRFRDGIAGVGISKMSAASRTTVGGYGGNIIYTPGQFEVNDSRDVSAVCAMLQAKGLQPVFKNWESVYRD